VPEDDKFLGVYNEVLEKYLTLIREKYLAVNAAAAVLEARTGVSSTNVTMTNLRDVLSHLHTLLTHPEASYEEQMSQVAGAEEHFRRALMEAYQFLIDFEGDKIEKTLIAYKEQVLPLRETADVLATAPNLLSIKALRDAIDDKTAKGREAKGENLWNKEWEDGVLLFTEASDELRELHTQLEDCIGRAAGVKERAKSALHRKINYAMGILAVVAILFTIFG